VVHGAGGGGCTQVIHLQASSGANGNTKENLVMARRYTIPYTGTLATASGDVDLFEINPADDKPVWLKRIFLSQTSETADAAEEILRITVQYFPATVTSGNGTASTIAAIDPLTTAAGFAAESNSATVATTSGTGVVLYQFAWNIRMSPTEIVFGPDMDDMPVARQGGALIVRCESTAADDITIAIVAEVLEG
jgi:hypothetical protein